MENENINPFTLGTDYNPPVISETNEPPVKKPTAFINPFDKLVNKTNTLEVPNINDNWKTQDTNTPVRVSTSASQDYIKRGFNINDLDLNPKLEQDLSSTQSRIDRLTNNLKVAGANLVSMAVVGGISNPLSTGEDDLKGGIGKDLFDWSTGVAKENRNYETANDASDSIWQQLTNWVNPLGNSTKGLGKLLESTAFGLGAGIGIAFQESIISLATDGIGTIPALANNIKRVLNSAKYLDRALEASGMAIKGANNLEKIVKTGVVTEKMSKALSNLYRSQTGAYSEALFEGLEGKETLKEQLINDFKIAHGYSPDGKDLDEIESESSALGQSRMNINRFLLSATNLSQFNSIFKTFNPVKETAEELSKKYGAKLLIKDGKVVVDKGSDLLKSAWFNKGIGKTINKSITGLYKASKDDALHEMVQEGTEEGLQFLIDKTLNNYYSWKYKGENKSFTDALIEGSKELFTKEGMESILTGALAGGGQSVVFNTLARTNKDFKIDKKTFQTDQQTLADKYNEFDKLFRQSTNDKMRKKVYTLFNNDSVNGTLHDKRTILNASVGTSEIKNNPEDLEQFSQANMHELFALALPYVQNGNIDILKEQFSTYKELDEEGFKGLFGVETKDKDKLIDYYLDEFDKIDNSFNRTNSAFDLHFKGNSVASIMSNQLYKEMKQELAFSLYNNDNLIKDAKELENKLVDYPKILNNYALNFPKQLEENEKEIKQLEKNLEITPNDITTKDKIKGLKKQNSYLNDILSGTSDVNKSEYIRKLNENIIVPHFKSLGKELPDAFKHTEETNDVLNTIYHLGKIKDRINYQQDKINKILYSSNPVEFFTNAQREFEELIHKITNNTNEEDLKVIPSEEESKEQEVELPNKPVSTETNLLPTPITPKPIKQEEVIEKPEDFTDRDNLLSKTGTIVYLIDKKGNVLNTPEAFINRAKFVYNFIENKNYDDLSYKLIDVKDYEDVEYNKEFDILIRKKPKKAIGVFKGDVSVGSFILDDISLEVNLKALGKLINFNFGIDSMELLDFIDLLKKDTENNLFEKVKNTKTLFHSNLPIEQLHLNHKQQKNTLDSIKTFIENNTLNEEGLAEFIKTNDLLESRCFINYKEEGELIPLKGSVLEDNMIVDFIDNEPTIVKIKESSNLTKARNWILTWLENEKDKEGQPIIYNGRFIFYRQQSTSGSTSIRTFNVNRKNAYLFKDELAKELSTLEDFQDRSKQLYYKINTDGENKHLTVNLNIFEKDDKSGIGMSIEVLDNGTPFENNKVQENDRVKTISLKQMTNKDFLNLIEENLKTLPFVQTIDVKRVSDNKEKTLSDINTILIPSFTPAHIPSQQVFTSVYLQVKPLEKALESKFVENNQSEIEAKKADIPTKENVTERLNIYNPFYKKVEDALVKLGLIEKFNAETKIGDVVGGNVRPTSDGGFMAGEMFFSKNGDVSYLDGDGNKVSFDKNGDVISENTKEVKTKKIQNTIISLKESIEDFKKLRDSELFKYREITKMDLLGNKIKVKVLKTSQELKESTDKINAQIDKSKSELEYLLSKEQTTSTNQSEIKAKKADIERRRREKLKSRFGNHVELISSKNNTVIQRNGLHLPNKETYPPQKVPTEKLFEEYDKINAKYNAELKVVEEQPTTTNKNKEKELPSWLLEDDEKALAEKFNSTIKGLLDEDTNKNKQKVSLGKPSLDDKNLKRGVELFKRTSSEHEHFTGEMFESVGVIEALKLDKNKKIISLKTNNGWLNNRQWADYYTKEEVEQITGKSLSKPKQITPTVSVIPQQEEHAVKDFNATVGALSDEQTPSIKINEKYFTKISKPLESKRLQYTFYTKYSDKEVTKNGYKLTIPEFPNVEIYISNEIITDESVKGNTEFNIKSEEWKIDVKHPSKGFLNFPKPLDVITKKDVINSFVEDINEKYSKDLNNLKILEEVGIFLKQEEQTPIVSVIQEQEELPLQVGQFYVDAGLPKIIESISYDKISDKYIVNGKSFSKGTLEYMSEKTNQTKYENDYDKLVKKQKESNTDLELKPGDYYVFGGKVGIINTIEKNGNEYIINGHKLNPIQYQYILDSTQKGLESRYNSSIISNKPPVVSDEENLKQLKKESSGITEQANLVEPEKISKLDSLLKYLEGFGYFLSAEGLALKNAPVSEKTGKTGEERLLSSLTKKGVVENTDTNMSFEDKGRLVVEKIKAMSQLNYFELREIKIDKKSPTNRLVEKIDKESLFNKIQKCF